MENQRSEFVSYLKIRGFNASEGNESNLINVRYPIDEVKDTLFIHLDPPFPYDFPKIFIDSRFKEERNINAHVFKGNSLCLKLSGKEIVNPQRSKEVLEYALKKACNVIDRAIDGSLNIEKTQEIKEYWKLSNKNGNHINCTSFVESDLIEDKITFKRFNVSKSEVFIYDIEEDFCGKDYMDEFALGQEEATNDFECLFVKVENSEVAFELRVFSRLISYLKELNIQKVNNFLIETLFGLITVVDENDMHVQYSTLFINSEKGDLMNLSKCDVVKKYNLVPKVLTQKALFNRSSDEKIHSQFKNILVIGCGSVGSVIASKLASAGAEQFWLVDNDILSENNLLRHVCGMDQMGKLKTNALKNHLLNNFPYLKIKELPISIFECSRQLFESIEFDLIVVATADRSTESYSLDELLSFGVAPKLLLLWIEPFAVSGHAIMYNKKDWLSQDFDMLNSNVDNISSVENSEIFFRKEVGCNSAYIPYSGLDVEDFVISLLKEIKFPKKYSFSYTKMLNVNWAKREKEIKLNPKYFGCSDNEVLIGEVFYE